MLIIVSSENRQTDRRRQFEKKLDLTETIKDGARMFLVDAGIRRQLIMALTEDSKLHIEEVFNNQNQFIKE
jgi:hypothetical protein